MRAEQYTGLSDKPGVVMDIYRRPRQCKRKECRREFVATSPSHVYCGKECAAAAKRAREGRV
jgi:hypothetical protein